MKQIVYLRSNKYFIISLSIFINILQLLDVFKVVYYPLIDGSTITTFYKLPSIINLLSYILFIYSLNLIFITDNKLGSIISFVSLILLYKPSFFAFVNLITSITLIILIGSDYGKFVLHFIMLLTIFNIFILIHWMILVPMNYNFFNQLSQIDIALHYVTSYINPLLILLILFTWFIKLILTKGMIITTNKFNYYNLITKKDMINGFLLLIFSLILGIMVGFVPYLTSLNAMSVKAGVDFPQYVEAMYYVNDDIMQIFYVDGGERSMFYLFIYLFKQIFNLSVETAVLSSPVILNILLVIATFFFTLELIPNNYIIAGWSSFFIVTSWQIMANLYAFFLSNVLSLGMCLLSLTFLFMSIRTNDKTHLLLSCIISCFIHFIHPWTMYQYLFPLVLTCIFLRFNNTQHTNLITYVSFFIFVELFKIILLTNDSVPPLLYAVPKLTENPLFWTDSIFGFRYLYGGPFSWALPLIFACVGIFVLSNNKVSACFIHLLVFTSSIIYLGGNSSIKMRILFNLPLGIFSSIGLMWISERLNFKLRITIQFYTVINACLFIFRYLVNYS